MQNLPFGEHLSILLYTTHNGYQGALTLRLVAESYSANLVVQTLGAKAAAALDQELMSTGAFSIDQLMELAGLAVSQAGQHTHTHPSPHLVGGYGIDCPILKGRR